jgi:hypothetical protein
MNNCCSIECCFLEGVSLSQAGILTTAKDISLNVTGETIILVQAESLMLMSTKRFNQTISIYIVQKWFRIQFNP